MLGIVVVSMVWPPPAGCEGQHDVGWCVETLRIKVEGKH